MSERIQRALARFVKSLEDPRARVYLTLLEALRPIPRGELLGLAKLHPAAVDRALRFLYTHHLVDKIRAGQEVYYYALV